MKLARIKMIMPAEIGSLFYLWFRDGPGQDLFYSSIEDSLASESSSKTPRNWTIILEEVKDQGQ